MPDTGNVQEQAQAHDSLGLYLRRHVEIDGNEFPFSRGVSFYEMDGSGKILRARYDGLARFSTWYEAMVANRTDVACLLAGIS